MNGKYEGDGMWTPCPSSWPSPCSSSPPVVRSSTATAAPLGSRTACPDSSSVYFRCQNSSRDSTCGISAKLYIGGGDDVVHSSVRASHGSSPEGFPRRRLTNTLTMKMSTETAMMNDPIVSSMFKKSQP